MAPLGVDHFPREVTGEEAAGETTGTSWHQFCPGDCQKAFVLVACNGFQKRASIFAANTGTKDVEDYCGLSKEELILLA